MHCIPKIHAQYTWMIEWIILLLDSVMLILVIYTWMVQNYLNILIRKNFVCTLGDNQINVEIMLKAIRNVKVKEQLLCTNTYIQGESKRSTTNIIDFLWLVADEITKRKLDIWFDNVFSFRYNFFFYFTLLVIKLHAFEGSLCFFDLSTKPVFYQIEIWPTRNHNGVSKLKTIVTNVGSCTNAC